MKNTMSRRIGFVAGAIALLAVGSALGWALAQPPSEPSAGSLAERHADLHARYAEARLRFAETRLQKAERLNASSPGQISAAAMRVLQSRVDMLREQLAATRDKPHGHGFAMQRRAAHAAVRLAEQELADARAVNNRRADTVQPTDILLHELQLKMVKLRAEIWDDPTFLASPIDVLQMQLDQLIDTIDDLEQRIDDGTKTDRR